MTTERLYEFLILAQTLSFSKAAKKLFVTQSTLSRHVAELEQLLGIPLLERTTHNVRLTEAGKVLARSAADILRRFEAVNGRLQLDDVQAAGTVVAACSEAGLSHSLLRFLRQFSEKYREIDLQIRLMGSEPPVGGAVDVFFSPFEYPALSGGVSCLTAFTDAAFLAVPAGHRLLYERRVGLDALKGETLIVPYGEELLCSFAANRQLTERYTGGRINVLKADTVKSALLLVYLGRGVSIVPQYLAADALFETMIVGVSNPECRFEVFAYWDRTRENPAARLFHEELQAFISMGG